MSPTPRQVAEQSQVREKILAAAREMFVKHGYESVSLRKLAESVGYTAPALYTHFTDKTAILEELCRRDFATLAGVFLKLGRIADPVERIYRIGLTYIKFAHEHPNHYRLMFMTPNLAGVVEPSAEDIEAMNDPDQDAYAFLHQAVRDALKAGRFRADLTDTQLIAQTLWAGVHGVASLDITHSDCPWADWRALDRRSKLMCAAVLRGMLNNPADAEAFT